MKNVLMVTCIVIWLSLALTLTVKAECSNTYVGTLGVKDEASLIDADQYDCIDGGLTLYGNYGVKEFVFRNLKYVSGQIISTLRRPPFDWSISFPALEHAYSVSIGSNRRLVYVSFGPDFFDTDQDVRIYSNANLAVLDLGGLTEVGDDFEVYRNDSLKWISATELEDVNDNLNIFENDTYPQCLADDFLDIPADEYRIEDNEVCQ